MIYGPEQLIQYPVKDLYDKQIMQMSIAAARDMYEKGQKQLEDFNTKYGDFMSPIAKDMDWYNQNVTGKVRDTINNLYANGIDPLRSAEGRAAISQLIYSMPTGDIAKIRQSAETAKEYLKNRGILEREGKYDRDLNERFLGYNLDNYSTLDQDGVTGMGIWDVTSPLQSQSLKELTEKAFNNRTAHELTRDDVLSFGPEWAEKYDPRAKYVGFTKKDLRDIADKVAPGLYGTPYAEYYRDLAKQKLIAAGYKPTEANINAQLAQDIANTQDEYLIKPSGTLSEWIQMENLKTSRAAHELAKKQYDATINNQKIGFTDRVKDAVRQKLASKPVGSNVGNISKTTKVMPGNVKNKAIEDYYNATVNMPGETDQLELEKMFYGYVNKSDEKYDIVKGQNRKRITFTETSGLYPTLQRAYDYKGVETKGVTSAFTKYLRKNKIYGYPIQEDFTVTHNANRASNIYDVNQYVEISANQLEGFFRQRYAQVSGRHLLDDTDYPKFKQSIMRQLGISEQPSIYSKIPFDDEENGQLHWKSSEDNYLLVPITRTKEIIGLGQAQIDTDADKEIASKDKLSGFEGIYHERDLKRRK